MAEINLNKETTIKEAGFEVRTHNILVLAAIENLGELAELPESVLRRIRNMGKKSIAEIKQKLAEAGLQLADEPADEKTVDLESPDTIYPQWYLSRTAYNLLVKERIYTWTELASKNLKDLQQIRHITENDINSILEALDKKGLKLATEPTEKQSPLAKAKAEKVRLTEEANLAKADVEAARDVYEGYNELSDKGNRGEEEPIQCE